MRKQMRVARMEFHVSRAARDRYQFDETLFSITGNVVFANFRAARVFAQKINDRRDLVSYPEQAIRAGQINAMGLIDEILHYTVGQYRKEEQPEIMGQALAWLYDKIGTKEVDFALQRFVDSFPPVAVYRREIDGVAYLEGETDGVPNRELVLEELIMLWLANVNPAFAPFLELFDDSTLEEETSYLQMVSSLWDFFETQPVFGPDDEPLLAMLRSPAIAVPHSLSGQLEYILSRWGSLLGSYLYRLLGSLDLIKEEEKLIFLGPHKGSTSGDIYNFAGQELEYERFSPDKDWMPKAVIIAKNAFVWLDQLSKRYQRPINTLDQIPDSELDELARWGINGLWLIGLWERSHASKTIKQIMGNPDAVASAYSLYDYRIAPDLGGEEACDNLRRRAWQRGIRLASDMVPNHMGIDSPWVINNPDWFISLDYSPYPSYSFGGRGPNLSNNPGVGLYLEDHYYDHSDAAVVFKRVDFGSGREQYIYHGNDGTSMPWNDTAQLNYLKPEVREAVIQTILHVARQFPIIRFDAAMTLAKKHFQRLWFPEPGTGGAIPSRSEHALVRDAFHAAMPAEFWREVVDRCAQEAPDTLLLAEAFWLMEGYFVRTLGMHRVYNSAFMNMLRDEENANYRTLIKNVIEFDPEIIKRFVNFMNNPDERTAVDQFGKGDKYFGICLLMSTLPGLPMFGHGQVEGYSEKYGMEYRWARWDEKPDEHLVQRHEREIFPLLHRRWLFAEAENFRLYDFFAPEGHVNEDVFAYSNRSGNERALVIYHNKFAHARGWVRTSVAFAGKTSHGGARQMMVQNLGEGLGLQPGEQMFSIFRDSLTGLEYIRSSREIFEQGIYVELEAYKAHVFLDFREVRDNEWHQYAHLASYLAGRGVPSIDDALKEIFLQPIHYPFKELVNAGFYRYLIDHAAPAPDVKRTPAGPAGPEGRGAARTAAPTAATPTSVPFDLPPELLGEVEGKAVKLLRGIKDFNGDGGDELALAREIRAKVATALSLPSARAAAGAGLIADKASLEYLAARLGGDDAGWVWGTLLSWIFTHSLGRIADGEDQGEQSRSWVDEWLLGKIIAGALKDLGLDEGQAWRAVAATKLLITHQCWFEELGDEPEPAYQVLEHWLKDGEVQSFIQVNRHMGVLWFNREAFHDLLWLMFAVAAIADGASAGEPEHDMTRLHAIIRRLRQAEEASGYQLEHLLDEAHTRA